MINSSHHPTIRYSTLVFGALLSLTLAPATWAQDTNGELLYRTHCATCHGQEGRGNGPIAPAMRKPPPDLTLLSRRNGGVFPEARVRRVVEGRDVESHGTREMPVWGDVFRMTSDGRSGDVNARLNAVVAHLRSLQQTDAQ